MLYLPAGLRLRLRRIALETGTSVNQLVIGWIREHLSEAETRAGIVRPAEEGATDAG